MIWHSPITIPQLQSLGDGTMGSHLGIEFTEIGENFLKAKMPVDHRTHQPYGLLHGGASATLAETLGSVASAYVVDMNQYYCVGLEINANHIRGDTGRPFVSAGRASLCPTGHRSLCAGLARHESRPHQ